MQLEIKNLKQIVNAGNILQDTVCSETPTDGDESDEASSSGACGPYISSHTDKDELETGKVGTEDLGDDIPLSSLVHRRGKSLSKVSLMERPASPVSPRTCTENEVTGRKRVRVMISDDESDHEMDRVRRDVRCSVEDVATSEGG